MVISANAATLNCTFTKTKPPACPSFVLFGLKSTNDKISVLNQPASYTDSKTTELNLDIASEYMSDNPQIIAPGQEFPRKIFNIFTNVQMFVIQNIKTKLIATNSFTNCKNITDIAILYSNITQIGAYFAQSCSNIMSVRIAFGYIKSIDKYAFEGLRNLKYMDLSYNNLKCLHYKTFRPLKKLETLKIRENKITTLHSQIFIGLIMLKEFYIDSNQVQYIPNFNLNTTGTATNSLIIGLDANPIKAISKNLLPSLYKSNRSDGNPHSVQITFRSFGMISSQVITCIPEPNYIPLDMYTIGWQKDWKIQDGFYGKNTTCYSAFTTKMGSDQLAACN